MALGTISTLGLGSGGVLNNDLVDQLKKADEASIIKPIENKIQLAQNKQDELSEIKKLVSSLNISVTNMTYDAPYDNVDTNITGDSVFVTTNGKVTQQNISIDVTQLATKDIYESNDGFSSKDSTLEAGTFTISHDGKDYDISIDDGDTLEDLVKKINENTDGNVEASILNVGGDNPYKLIVKSKETGEKNQISINTDSDSFSNGLDRVGDPAQDAKFKVDGVEITRSSNQVDDLLENITINLEKTGTSNISIKRDDSKIIDGIKDFVEKFNDVVKKISDDTKYNSEDKSAGIFQGNTQIREISRTLKDIVSTTISKDGKGAYDFGLNMNRDGTITFDESKFKEAYSENPDQTVEFFKASDATNGMFNKLESSLFDISISSKGTLKTLKNNFDDDLKRYEESLKNANKKLDDKYDILTQKFASYDLVMGKLDSQAQTLDNMIKAQFDQK